MPYYIGMQSDVRYYVNRIPESALRAASEYQQTYRALIEGFYRYWGTLRMSEDEQFARYCLFRDLSRGYVPSRHRLTLSTSTELKWYVHWLKRFEEI